MGFACRSGYLACSSFQEAVVRPRACIPTIVLSAHGTTAKEPFRFAGQLTANAILDHLVLTGP